MSFACLIIITVINCISVQFSSVRSFVRSPRSPLGLLHTFFTPVSFLVCGSTLISAAVCCFSSAFCRWEWNVVLCSLVALSMPSTAENDRDTGDRRSRCCCRRLRCRRRRRRWAEHRRDEERERRAKSSLQLRGKGQLHVCLVCLCAVCMCVPLCACVCALFVCVCMSRWLSRVAQPSAKANQASSQATQSSAQLGSSSRMLCNKSDCNQSERKEKRERQLNMYTAIWKYTDIHAYIHMCI